MANKIKLENDLVSIFKQDHFGRGITKLDNLLVFVDKALPFEKCKIEIINKKKNYCEAIIKAMILPSKDRVIPDCPYYNSCGGCHIMHQQRVEQLKFKENKVKELLERFTNLKDIKVKPIIYDKQFYYRNKIILHSKNNKLGFYQEKTHDIVEINTCMITTQEINEVYHKILNYLKEFPNNKVEEIMIRSNYKKEIMIVIDGKIDKNNFISYFNETSSIYINDELVHGNSYLYEKIFGLKFKVYPKSFFQVNEDMMKQMYKIVMDYYKNKNYSLVLDLYCGTGTIGMLVSKYVKEVIGVEIVSDSIKAAKECQKENNISNISFYNGKVEDLIDTFKQVDSIIIDPPRKGLDKYTIDNILKLNPESIIYVSCDPATLARDLNILKDNYNVIEVNPIDMFPNTYHVECVCVLKRK